VWGVGLNLVLALVAPLATQSMTVAAILTPFVALQVGGAALVAAGKPKIGAICTMIGSAAFIPLGAIALVGARRVLDELEQLRFQERRAAGR
jgi:hypothetical protein